MKNPKKYKPTRTKTIKQLKSVRIMNKLLTLIIIAKLLLSISVDAQKQHPLIPQSPTAAAAGKYGDIDVSLYTGQINPTIRLFDIKFNDFDFPISLNYASSGLKVHEIPASTGMGTSLSCIYVVNRLVRSVPDEQTHGYNGQNYTATIVQSINAGGYSPTPAYSSVTLANFKKEVGQTDFDGEPDLFNVSGPNFGGKFFFDETQIGSSLKNGIFIPKQAVTMSANFNYSTLSLFNPANTSGGIDKFTFYDSKGVKYTFDKKEGAILDDDDYQYGKNIVNTWYLGEIETPNGNKLTFNYIQRTIDLPHAQSEYRYLYLENPGNLDYGIHKTVSRMTTSETVLSEILINNGTWGKVKFIENTANREDWSFSQSGTKPKSLKEIVLKDGKDSTVKKYAFTYDANIANRLLLRNITEYGIDGKIAQEPYRFDYYGESQIPTLPFEGSGVINREDHWGYYNDNSTNSLLPDYQYIITSFAGIKDTLSVNQFKVYSDSLKVAQKGLSFEQISANKSNMANYTYFVTATNRSPDFTSALIGQLQKITYPSKASSEFVYEANSYYSNQGDEFNPCAGDYQNVISATKTNPLACADSTKSFTIAEGAFVCMKVNWNITIFSQGQDLIEGNVVIVGENGPVFSKGLIGNNSQNPTPSIGSEYVVLSPGNYTITADLCGENANGSNASSASITVQGIPVTPNAYVTRTSGGIRIKETKDCPSNIATDCLVKEYDYSSFSDPSNSSGRIVTKGRYYYPIKYFSTIIVNAEGFINALYLNSASQLPLSTTLGHYVGYNNVTVKEAKILANGQRSYKGKTVFDYRSPDELETPDIASGAFPFWSISLDWKRGVIQQSSAYDQTGTLLSDTQNNYIEKPILGYLKFTGLKAGKFIFNLEASPTGAFQDTYAYNKYASISGFQYNQRTISKEQYKVKDINNNDVLSSKTDTTYFTYNNDIHLQPTSTQTKSSKGEILFTQYQYPHDITGSSDALLASATSLIANSKEGELLRTESFRDGISIIKSENYYASFGGKVLPSSQKSFIGGSATAANESQQLSYDSYGNLTSFKENNGPINSLMWAYNGQYPVVYMVNGLPADPNSLLSTSDSTTLKNTADNLRTTFADAHISNYIYEPMIGLKVQNDPAQIETSYSYDGLNRLKRIFDKDGNIVKAFEYQTASSVGGNNFIKEFYHRKPSTTLLTSLNDVKTTINYFDGLGRSLQTVALNAGHAGTNDVVTNATTYDGFGRMAKAYIPFPNTGSGALASLPTSFEGDTRPFTENILFDESPLNRLLEIRGIGQDWASDKTKTFTEATGGQKSFSIATNGSVTTSTYPANSLLKKTVIDEVGNSTAEYSDKEGRTVLKEQKLNATETAQTAFIYNNIGQLTFIVQPEAYSTTGFAETDAIFTNGIFAYKYDERGRTIAKHVPNGGWTKMVYDRWDREVLSQTPLQLTDSKWTFTKYDALNRIIFTGEKTIANKTHANLQTDAMADPDQSEARNSTAPVYYSTNTTFPTIDTVTDIVYQINYYDTYNYNSSNWANGLGFINIETSHSAANAKGLLTGSKVLNQITGNSYLRTANYYDFNKRIIQSLKEQQLANLPEITSYEYNFAGEILQKKQKHYKPGDIVLKEINSNTLDHQGRVLINTHSIDDKPTNIANYVYDTIGRVKTKLINSQNGAETKANGDWAAPLVWQNGLLPATNSLVKIKHNINIPAGYKAYAKSIEESAGVTLTMGLNSYLYLSPATNTNPLQTIDIDYHIRGGIMGVNLDASKNPNPNAAESDLFSYKLTYKKDNNILAQYWKNSVANQDRSWTYDYDGASRLLSAAYAPSGTNSLSGISYDKNGNIKSLVRNGIDNLVYDYAGSINRLNYVKDNANNVAGFKDNSGGGTNTDYEYWPDGSLKVDKNKGASLIEYDTYLKKVKKITFSSASEWLKFYYAGDGTLIRRESSIAGNKWDYTDGLIYKNENPYQMNTAEGRAVWNGTDWEYEYEYRDHLGNLRSSFKNGGSGVIEVQTSENDAWGLNIPALSSSGANPQNIRFQNQELIEDFGLNLNWFKYRPFDPSIGKGWQVDRFSEKYSYWSPYAFSGNRITDAIEIDGLEPHILFKTKEEAVKNYGQQYNGKAIIKGVEFGANVYRKTAADGKTYFAYDKPVQGTAASVHIPELETKNSKRVGTIHAHGEYLEQYKNNEFSPQDIENAEKRGVDNYVTTPNGSIQKYDVKTNKVTTITNTIPSDPKDPQRLNKVAPILNPKPVEAVPVKPKQVETPKPM